MRRADMHEENMRRAVREQRVRELVGERMPLGADLRSLPDFLELDELGYLRDTRLVRGVL